MRWLVEVSHVGEETASERYCIEARRWQSALQEARRLRGDPGALPKLTIELLDHGYRAVDPALKVRYLVSEAPADMPLTEGAQASLTARPPPLASEQPPKPASEPATAAALEKASVAPAKGPASVIPAQVIRNRDERPAGDPIAYRELALAVKAGSSAADLEALLRERLEDAKGTMPTDAKRYVQIAVFDHVFVKRPVRSPLATLMWKEWRGDPVLAFPGFGATTEAPPPSTSQRPAPSWMPPAGGPVTLGSTLPSTAPVAASPSVPPAPTVQVVSSVPAPAAASARPGSVKPSPVVSVGKSSPPKSAPPRPDAAPVSEPPPPSGPDIDVVVETVSVSPSTHAALIEAESERLAAAVAARYAPTLPATDASGPALQAVAAAEAPLPLTRRSEAPLEAAPVPLTRRSEPPGEAAVHRRSEPPTRRSDPGVARRRGPNEDLIGELFERMHELSFMVDLVSGADFVLRVLSELLPSEGILVHAFDLARHEFVVVRARGPKARDALMHKTPDADPLVHQIMRQRSVASNGASPVRSGAFVPLGVEPRIVLCGAARQGGRYLGLIELANPLGDTPFHEGEVNAFEYVCEQFAEFVSQRPVVLDPDVVLGM